MSVNDDAAVPGSDSFWEVDNYKRTVKRHEDGNRLCHDLITMIQERADIEKQYAKSLKAWSKKWSDLIEKGPEYGTLEAATKGVLEEAEGMADIHLEVKDKLLTQVQTELKSWNKENYHKPMMGMCKETKELEDGFKKAQKPWAKLLAKVQKARKDFHLACKLEKTATVQENNAKGDSAVSADQLKKLQEKVEKSRNDVVTTRKRYEQTLNDLNGVNAKYMEDMTEVFDRSQQLEQKRLTRFKDILFGLHSCLNVSELERIPRIYQQLYTTINQADASKDLKWWSHNHGVDMPMNWPTFDEYSPDLHSISRKQKGNGSGSLDGGITLTSVQSRGNEVPKAEITSGVSQQATAPVKESTNGTQNDNANPFGDEDWDDDDVDDNTEGVPVRALYNYEAKEDDELTFRAGDVFVKLRDRDDQGWCRGRKDGRVGLYPDDYAQNIS